jgi:membrane protein implicated in regulation of membrane protease activity
MEVLKISITSEESRSYHNLIGRLKALNLVDWLKAYIVSVIYVVILGVAFYALARQTALYVWFVVPTAFKLVAFLILLFIAAMQRSANKQVANLLNKYFVSNLQEEILRGKIRLKKVKVVKDMILVYYRKDE